MEPIEASEESINSRLEQLGVSTAPDQLEELASAYPALQAWIRIADELAHDEPS